MARTIVNTIDAGGGGLTPPFTIEDTAANVDTALASSGQAHSLLQKPDVIEVWYDSTGLGDWISVDDPGAYIVTTNTNIKRNGSNTLVTHPNITSSTDVRVIVMNGTAGGAGGSGSGEINYITNTSGATNTAGWLESTNGKVDISRTDTASELPRENTSGTGFKIVGTSAAAGEYVAYDFDLDDSDVSSVLKLSWYQKPISGYTAGDFEVVIYDLDNSAEIIPAITVVPNYTGKFQTTWVSNSTSTNYELRIKSTVDSSAGLIISNVIVGPGSRVQIPDPRWPSYDESEVEVTTNGAAATVVIGEHEFIPYQDSSGNWRMVGNGRINHGSDTALDIKFAGTVFRNTIAQAVTVYYGGSYGAARPNEDRINIVHDTAKIATIYSFDVALASKPTWATKSAPDLYLSGAVNTDQVGLVATRTSTQQTGISSETTLIYNNIVLDTEDAFNTTTGEYTIPSDGQYLISASAALETSATPPSIALIKIMKNATLLIAGYDETPLTGSKIIQRSNTVIAECVAGDVIKVAAITTSNSVDFYPTNSSVLSITKLPSPQDVANMIVGHNLATEDRPGLVQPSTSDTTQEISSGTWTPSYTGVTNISSFSTEDNAQYMKVGNVVTVSGRLRPVYTAAGAAAFTVSLPVEPDANFSEEGEAAGIGADREGGTAFQINASTGAKTLQFRCSAVAGSGTRQLTWTATYRLR